MTYLTQCDLWNKHIVVKWQVSCGCTRSRVPEQWLTTSVMLLSLPLSAPFALGPRWAGRRKEHVCTWAASTQAGKSNFPWNVGLCEDADWTELTQAQSCFLLSTYLQGEWLWKKVEADGLNQCSFFLCKCDSVPYHFWYHLMLALIQQTGGVFSWFVLS